VAETRIFDSTWLKTSVADFMKTRANAGVWDGCLPSRYFDRCKAFHKPSGTLLIYTRDTGYHTSGWWKNPDFERCKHLSISFRDPGDDTISADRDLDLTREWIGLFFGAARKHLWSEPPFSDEGKQRGVWHYRLFCTPNWHPIRPRGEVYSRELTEAGWRSWSDVQADEAEKASRLIEEKH